MQIDYHSKPKLDQCERHQNHWTNKCSIEPFKYTWAKAQYSASDEKLEVVAYFLAFHEIREEPR